MCPEPPVEPVGLGGVEVFHLTTTRVVVAPETFCGVMREAYIRASGPSMRTIRDSYTSLNGSPRNDTLLGA